MQAAGIRIIYLSFDFTSIMGKKGGTGRGGGGIIN